MKRLPWKPLSVRKQVEMACGNCGRAKDKHVEGLLGRLGCYNTSGSTTYEPTAPSTPAPPGSDKDLIASLRDELARERESRKQAEAALRKAHEQTEQAAHNLCTCVNRSTWSCNACMSLLPIERTLSAALAVQEPAERERGK